MYNIFFKDFGLFFAIIAKIVTVASVRTIKK